jgi:hypothetical protein
MIQTESQRIDSAPERAVIGSHLDLTLRVADPEVIADLLRRSAGAERDCYALGALRLGILALRLAGGQLDAATVREAGQELLADLRAVLVGRSNELTGQISAALSQYFDPRTGALPQRLESLLAKNGELDLILKCHLGSDDSTLARTLSSRLGDNSPIFKLLSPTESSGLRAQVADTVRAALQEQREIVLREFTLDAKGSALSRLVAEIRASQGDLKAELGNQIQAVVGEFSLDHPDSALARLVARVEVAQKTIADQFSVDNEHSAINKLSHLLQGANTEIGRNLTLDNEHSALARLRKELVGTIEEIERRNHEFHTEVRVTLASLHTRREEAARSTRHGATFEAHLGELLAFEAQRVGDVYRATGAVVGSERNCKTGDYVIQLGPESLAPGARIAWEAKEDKRYDLTSALAEIDIARKNRDATIGIFVFSKKACSPEMLPLMRYGQDIVIVWDDEDTSTDLYVNAAYSVARALCVRACDQSPHAQQVVMTLEQVIRAVEKQIQHLDQIKTWSETVRGHGEKICERTVKMKTDLVKEVERLDETVATLQCPHQDRQFDTP